MFYEQVVQCLTTFQQADAIIGKVGIYQFAPLKAKRYAIIRLLSIGNCPPVALHDFELEFNATCDEVVVTAYRGRYGNPNITMVARRGSSHRPEPIQEFVPRLLAKMADMV